MNFFGLSGEIKSIQVFDKVAAKATAVMLVQYGPSRERGNRSVEFVNACKIRVPPYRFAKIKANLVVGAFVEVKGHIQGIYKLNMGEGSLTFEHVADFLDFPDTEIDGAPGVEVLTSADE